jgi:pilus assembly protein Flp/PilA
MVSAAMVARNRTATLCVFGYGDTTPAPNYADAENASRTTTYEIRKVGFTILVDLTRSVMTLLGRLDEERGQGLAEYGLILALVAVVVVGAVTLLGTNVQSMVNSIARSI